MSGSLGSSIFLVALCCIDEVDIFNANICYTITNITNIQSATRDWPDDSPATCSKESKVLIPACAQGRYETRKKAAPFSPGSAG
mgnify:CR=1